MEEISLSLPLIDAKDSINGVFFFLRDSYFSFSSKNIVVGFPDKT